MFEDGETSLSATFGARENGRELERGRKNKKSSPLFAVSLLMTPLCLCSQRRTQMHKRTQTHTHTHGGWCALMWPWCSWSMGWTSKVVRDVHTIKPVGAYSNTQLSIAVLWNWNCNSSSLANVLLGIQGTDGAVVLGYKRSQPTLQKISIPISNLAS